jgi:hypothetical protein
VVPGVLRFETRIVVVEALSFDMHTAVAEELDFDIHTGIVEDLGFDMSCIVAGLEVGMPGFAVRTIARLEYPGIAGWQWFLLGTDVVSVLELRSILSCSCGASLRYQGYLALSIWERKPGFQ